MSLFKPMKTVNESMDFNDVAYPKIATIKFDGVYALNLKGKLLGRSLKPLKNKWITEKLSQDKFAGLVGELINAKMGVGGDDPLRMNRQDLYNNTNSSTGTIVKEDWDFIWVLFDYVGDGTKAYCETPYNLRMRDLIEKLSGMHNSMEIAIHNIDGIEYDEFLVDGMTFLVAAPFVVEDAEQAEATYERLIEAGHEGMILREIEGIFKFGRATKKTQEKVRFKPSGDSEIIITSIEPMYENQNEAKINELGYTERSSHQENKVQLDMVGALIGIDINSGEEVKIGAGKLTHDERTEVWKNQKKYVGRLAKYRFMATGIKTKPRHPRWIGWRDITDVDESVIALAKAKDIKIVS